MISPVLKKELYGTSRRKRTYVFRVLYVVGISFLLWWQWMETNRYAYYGYGYSNMARIGRDMFGFFISMQMVALAFASVFSSSDRISSEVHRGTLGLLVLTPLTPFQIVFGKWKAAMTQMSLAVLCGIPIVAIAVYLNGATPFDLLWSGLLTISFASLGVAVGLLASSTASSGWMASIQAILLLVLWTLLPLLLTLFLYTIAEIDEQIIEFWVTIHPVYCLAFMMNPAAADHFQFEHAWLISTAVSFGLSFLLIFLASRRIPRLASTSGRPTASRRLFKWMDAFFDRIDPFKVRLFSKTGVWGSNPVLWKELHTRMTGTFRYTTRICLVLLVLTIPFVPFMVDGTGRMWLYLILFTLLLTLFLVAGGTGASLFVKEKEERKLDILLSTPLRDREIINGKLLGGTAGLFPLTLVVSLLGLIAAWFPSQSFLNPLLFNAAFLIFILFTYVLGVYFSISRDSMRGAFGCTMAWTVGILAGFPILFSMFGSRLRTPGDDDFGSFVVTVTNPFTYAELLQDRSPGRFAFGFAIYGLTYGLVILILYWRMFRRLKQKYRTSPVD